MLRPVHFLESDQFAPSKEQSLLKHSQSVSGFQAAFAWKLGPTLEWVPSICQTRQVNAPWRGLDGTLGLRSLSIPLKGTGSTVLSQVRWAPGQPGKRSCFHKGSSAAVLYVYTFYGKTVVWKIPEHS